MREGGATVVAHAWTPTHMLAIGTPGRRLLGNPSRKRARPASSTRLRRDFAENVTTEGIDLLAFWHARAHRREDVLLEHIVASVRCATRSAPSTTWQAISIFPREGIFSAVALEGARSTWATRWKSSHSATVIPSYPARRLAELVAATR